MANATEKQITFILRLIAERSEHNGTGLAAIVRKGLPMGAASEMIKGLLKTPADQKAPGEFKPVAPEFPAGRYALVNGNDRKVYFFQVDRPTEGKWSGYTFVKRVSGDNLLRVERVESRQVLAAIGRDPLEAAARYGCEHRVCGVCGHGLTDEESRTLGIGPVCIKKFGDFAVDRAWKLAAARREAEQERVAYEMEMDES